MTPAGTTHGIARCDVRAAGFFLLVWLAVCALTLRAAAAAAGDDQDDGSSNEHGPNSTTAAESTVYTPREAEARYAGKGNQHWTPAPTSSFGHGPCEESIEKLLSSVSAFLCLVTFPLAIRYDIEAIASVSFIVRRTTHPVGLYVNPVGPNVRPRRA